MAEECRLIGLEDLQQYWQSLPIKDQIRIKAKTNDLSIVPQFSNYLIENSITSKGIEGMVSEVFNLFTPSSTGIADHLKLFNQYGNQAKLKLSENQFRALELSTFG